MDKQKLKLYLLSVFLIGIIFVACNQDDSIEKHQHETKNPNFKLEKVKFEKFSKNSKLIKQLTKIIPDKTSNSLGKTVSSTDGNFTINTEFATYLETGINKHSYTFKIKRNNSEYLLENLILNSNDSLGYDAYIVQYDINQNEYNTIVNNIPIDLTSKMTLLKLNDDSFISNIFSKESFEIQTMCLNYITVCGSGQHWGANGSNGNLHVCDIPGTFNTYYAWVSCTETIDLGDIPSGGGGGNGGGGGGTGSGDSGSDYDPTDPDIHGGGSVSTAPTFEDNENENPPQAPCPGNPVKNPEICPSSPTNKKGGTFGCTRTHPTKKCNGQIRKKKHGGVDIKGEVFDRVYSMKSGIVVDVRSSMDILEYKANSLGNYIEIETNTSWGTTIRIKYCHLGSPQFNVGDIISQGDFIGYIGRSGNAAASGVTTHLHIQSKELFSGVWVETNPIDYFDTIYDSNTFEPIGSKTNCQQ